MGRMEATRRARNADGGAPTRLEFYAVRSFLFDDEERDRVILGEGLRHAVPGSVYCRKCLLFETGLCPGLREA